MTDELNRNGLLAALKAYAYQPDLTERLDRISGNTNLSRETAYEIVLWKLDRFVAFSDALLGEINSIANLTAPERGRAKPVFRSLLMTRGISVPMASTILRFRNPQCFQIIDERAYRRALPNGEPIRVKPQKLTNGWLSHCEKIYFEYLARLDDMSHDYGIKFELLDRALYQDDIGAGNPLGMRRR